MKAWHMTHLIIDTKQLLRAREIVIPFRDVLTLPDYKEKLGLEVKFRTRWIRNLYIRSLWNISIRSSPLTA